MPVTSMMTLAQIDEHEYLITLCVAALTGAGGAVALLLAVASAAAWLPAWRVD